MNYNALKELTKGLQNLQKIDKIVELPETISIDDFQLSPEVAEFIRKSEEYRERTKNVSIGQYK